MIHYKAQYQAFWTILETTVWTATTGNSSQSEPFLCIVQHPRSWALWNACEAPPPFQAIHVTKLFPNFSSQLCISTPKKKLNPWQCICLHSMKLTCRHSWLYKMFKPILKLGKLLSPMTHCGLCLRCISLSIFLWFILLYISVKECPVGLL